MKVQPVIVLIFIYSVTSAAKDINILNYGAVGDGTTLNTQIIQSAIDECSRNGGGRVIFSAGGKFLSGTIFLKDNVTLYMEKNSVLLGSPDMKDYDPKNLIRAYGVNNIGIAGEGTIDGQGHNFWYRKPDLPRSKKLFGYRQTWQYEHMDDNAGNLIQLEKCRNILVEDVTLKNAESWSLHLLACYEVRVEGIKIRNPFIGPNTDGIDVHHTSNVVISNCDIFTADDAIVLKTGEQKYVDLPCRNITITNCIITNLTSSIKTGTGTYGRFENIVINNCIFACGLPTDELAQPEIESIDPDHWGNAMGSNTGLAINCVDGGMVNGFHVSNIVMQGIRCPIFVRLANRVKESDQRENPVPGSITNVKISDITAYDAALASSITGIPGYCVDGISLSNITIQTKGSGTKELADEEPEEFEDRYPRSTNWGNLHVSGLFVRHVRNLEMKDVKITLDAEDERPLIDIRDVRNLYCDHIASDRHTNATCMVTLYEVTDAVFLNCMFPDEDPYWFDLRDGRSGNIRISSPLYDVGGKVRTDSNRVVYNEQEGRIDIY